MTQFRQLGNSRFFSRSTVFRYMRRPRNTFCAVISSRKTGTKVVAIDVIEKEWNSSEHDRLRDLNVMVCFHDVSAGTCIVDTIWERKRSQQSLTKLGGSLYVEGTLIVALDLRSPIDMASFKRESLQICAFVVVFPHLSQSIGSKEPCCTKERPGMHVSCVCRICRTFT